MKKLNKLTITLISIITLFATCTVVFLCLFLSYINTSNIYKTQLENNYMKSFYEMVDNVNSLEVDLSKIIATSSISGQRELLVGIYDTCRLGVNNLNSLPISIENLTEINKMLNTAGGFAFSLLQQNYNGKQLSDNDFEQLSTIYDKIREMQYDLNNYMQRLHYDFELLDGIDFKSGENSSFTAGLVNTESSSGKVPSLIYDGPFSDSVLNKEIVGLSDTIYSKDTIEARLHELFTGFSIYYTGDSLGKFDTYNFDVKGDVDLYVSITKRGGFLLNITAFSSGGNARLTKEEGITLSEDFASDMGISNMYCVWSQQTGNILYVNLAPIVDKVIYYSDLIKVKVDLAYGLVVGWEATNYATNHTSRTFNGAISLSSAEKLVSPQLTITERNFCIIPDKFVGELSAYEFICTWGDYTYYVYIDANTGEEANILRVINTSNGDLLM